MKNNLTKMNFLAPALAVKSLDILLCCTPGMDNFVDDIIHALKPDIRITKLISVNLDDFRAALDQYDTIWLEWGNQLAEVLTNAEADRLKNKRVICRIHSYEVMEELADRLNFSVIDDLVFVAPHIRDYLLNRRPEIAKLPLRIHVVPNGIVMDRFPLTKRSQQRNIAFLGNVNFKKDPMVLMHAFQAIYARDPRYTLHIGGGFQCFRASIALPQFVRNNRLENAVRFYGPIKDVRQWLEPMNYIILTSLMEGHPVALMEAMATGCQPLIYRFPGADALYPPEFMWSNFEDLLEKIKSSYPQEVYRKFVQDNYSIELQVQRLRKFILSN